MSFKTLDFCLVQLTFSLIYVNNILVESDIPFPSNYNVTSTNTFLKSSSWLANKCPQLLFIMSYLNGDFLPGKFLLSIWMWKACSNLEHQEALRARTWDGFEISGTFILSLSLICIARFSGASHLPKYSPLHGMPL